MHEAINDKTKLSLSQYEIYINICHNKVFVKSMRDNRERKLFIVICCTQATSTLHETPSWFHKQQYPITVGIKPRTIDLTS